MIRELPTRPRKRWWFALGLASFVAMFLGTLQVYGWGPPVWRELTASSREATLLVSAFVAPICAAIPRALTSRSVVVGPIAVRASTVMKSHLSMIAAATAGGSLTAILVAAFTIAREADAGGPNALSLLSTVLAAVAVGSIAYTLSTMIPQRAGGVLAAVLGIMIVFIPPLMNPLLANTGRSSRQPSFVWLNGVPLIGGEVTTQTSILRIVLFTLVIVACWAVSIARLRRPFGPRVLALGAAATAACMAVVAVAVSPPLVQPDPAEALCDQSDGLEVCLHPEYASLTGPVATTASTVRDVVPEQRYPDVVQQTGTLRGSAERTVHVQLDRVGSDRELRSAVVVPLSQWASGAPACQAHSQGEGIIPEDVAEAYDIQHALALTIQERLGLDIRTGSIDEATGQMVRPPELETLAVLDDEALREWMEGIASEIEQCSLTADLLP